MYHANYIINSKIINTKHQMLWNKKRCEPDIRKYMMLRVPAALSIHRVI